MIDLIRRFTLQPSTDAATVYEWLKQVQNRQATPLRDLDENAL
jgi:hypothetical protein